ncbi:MAG: SGNH/GDSL hydrolase family protein [Victivallales bacterium]|nr:SGNH/GDSL hydrolase family protein [Victivallales bacterium]
MSSDRPVREIPFPNDVIIEAGIEPSYKDSDIDLGSSPRIVGEKITYHKGDKDTYKIITIDLGDQVIKKGSWFGVWVSLENLDGEKFVPMSRTVGSRKKQNFETSYTSAKTSFIKGDFIRKTTRIKKVNTSIDWATGYCPVAILAKTDYKGDVWGIIGSSIPEGYYDKYGNRFGDENGNIGYADKLCSTKLGAPSVNLAKGSDKFLYCAQELKGRLDILKVCNVNKVHVGLGGNDISAHHNVKKLRKNAKIVLKLIKAIKPDIEVYNATVLPHSKSTDGFTTLNQTPSWGNAGNASVRGEWNGALRADPKSFGYDGTFELCSFVEYDWKDSASKWLPDETPEKYTTDGTHPTCDGSEAIAEHAYLIGEESKSK